MEELLWTGMVVALSGALIAGLGAVVPIMLGKYGEKWYPTFMHVAVTAGSVIALEGLAIMVYVALHHPLILPH